MAVTANLHYVVGHRIFSGRRTPAFLPPTAAVKASRGGLPGTMATFVAGSPTGP